MRLEFSPLAETDLEAIGDYIASDSPGNAPRFVRALGEQCSKKKSRSPPWPMLRALNWLSTCALARMCVCQ